MRTAPPFGGSSAGWMRTRRGSSSRGDRSPAVSETRCGRTRGPHTTTPAASSPTTGAASHPSRFMGHLLISRLLDGADGAERADVIAAALGQADLLAAAGIRTLSSDAVRYRSGGIPRRGGVAAGERA